MDYLTAAVIYVASILGVFISIYGAVVCRYDRKLTVIMVLTGMVFAVTMYLGGAMLNAIS